MNQGTIGTARLAVLLFVLLALGLSAVPSAAQAEAEAADDARITLLQAKPRAYAIVEQSMSSDQWRVRLAGLEAAQHAPDAASDLARRGLIDENPAVRFGALVTIGKLELKPLADAALDLMKDESQSVRAAAMFAAKRCGKDVDLTPLAQMLASSSPSARANAAMLIGQLGDPQAIGMLREMAGQRMPRVSTAQRAWVRLQFAEAMIRLEPDNVKVLDSIRAAMFSNLPDLRVLSMQILGEVGDQAARGGLARVVQDDNPIQVKIAAAQAMARMGDLRAVPTLMRGSAYDDEALEEDLEAYLDRDEGVSPSEAQAIRQILEDEKVRARTAAEVRAQAAVALGWVKTQASAKRLAKMQDDPDPIVQIAAASSVLRASR